MLIARADWAGKITGFPESINTNARARPYEIGASHSDCTTHKSHVITKKINKFIGLGSVGMNEEIERKFDYTKTEMPLEHLGFSLLNF